MSGTEHARVMLEMAAKDLKSLRSMLQPLQHDDEVFGFHAQQAIEKSLDAWIAGKNLKYPHTHDLSALLQHLEDAGEAVEPFWDLVEYTTFGVQYRYEAMLDIDERIDRNYVLDRVEHPFTFVSQKVS